jgi:hypothetical protein
VPREAFFLPAAPGQRLCVLHTPPAGVAVRGQVLYVHPWAEEMNKARRMAALQAAALAAAGWRVLQIDLHGCGDSSDTWAEASWTGWVDDVVRAAHWLTGLAAPLRPHATPGIAAAAGTDAAGHASAAPAALPLWLWGLRAGALLASAAAARLSAPCHFLFWQPTPAGKPLLQQFLRLKGAAASLAGPATPATAGLAAAGAEAGGGGGGAKAAIDAARRGLAAGQVQHIAGYPLSAALAQGLEAATLAPPALPPGLPASQVLWFEVSSRPEATLLPASMPSVQAWRAAGHTVHTEVVPGPAFWQTQEIEDAPALLAATTRAMDAMGGATGATGATGGSAANADQSGQAMQPRGEIA